MSTDDTTTPVAADEPDYDAPEAPDEEPTPVAADVPGDDLEEAMRNWAHGTHATEAGVELLIRSGLARRGEVRAIWRVTYANSLILDRPSLASAVASNAMSGGERRLFAIAASLLDGVSCPVDLGDAAATIDRANMRLVLAAVSHAAGTHQEGPLPDWMADLVPEHPSEPVDPETGYYAPLYPWPA